MTIHITKGEGAGGYNVPCVLQEGLHALTRREGTNPV